MRVALVQCVSTADKMFRFATEQLVMNSGHDELDYIVVTWHPSELVVAAIQEMSEKFTVSHPGFRLHHVSHEVDNSVGYVPNLRKMMNEGFIEGLKHADYVGLVNTDQSYFRGVVAALVKHLQPNQVTASWIVDTTPGTRLTPGFLGLPEYGGGFDWKAWVKFGSELIKDEVQIFEGEAAQGLEGMPYLFHRSLWEKVGPWELTMAGQRCGPDGRFFRRAYTSGFRLCLVKSALAYHIEGVERGIRGRKEIPWFARNMPNE